jgi:signal transduction histidine kinase
LNNPVAAMARSAKTLAATLERVETASRELGAACLTNAQLAAVQKVRDLSIQNLGNKVRSPLEQEDRENEVSSWLRRHQAEPALAEPLAETDVTPGLLDELAKDLSGDALNKALQWIAADFSTGRLSFEIQRAASRVSGLVAAIKGYTQMDRSTVPEPVDILQGLKATIVVLGSKARGKAVGLTLNVDANPPLVNGFASELNQIWSTLIDNALDAAGPEGEVEVRVSSQETTIMVRVIDNGGGIPPEIRERIFEPFFTTKPVGAGTGLGLDIARRMVQHHNGRIELDSRPGRTEFRVCIPIDGIRSQGVSP